MIQRLLNVRSWIAAMITAVIALFVLIFTDYGHLHQANVNHWLLGGLDGFPQVSKWFSFVILIGLGFLLRGLLNRLKLSTTKGYYQPAIFSLLLIPVVQGSPFMEVSAVACFIIACMMLHSIYQINSPRSGIHRVGIALGVAVILEPSLIFGFFILFGMMLRLGQRNWRNSIIMLIGTFFPFVIMVIILLIFNLHNGVVSSLTEHLSSSLVSNRNYISWTPAIIITLSAIFGLSQKVFSGSVRERELLQTSLIWFLGAILFAFSGLIKPQLAMIISMMPATGFVSLWLEKAPKFWIADVVIIVLASALLLV